MSSSISSLPPELICQIFTHAHDFTTVSSLAKTSRIFYDTWRENPATICNAVLPRVISNFTDAERLLKIQEEAEVMSNVRKTREPRAITRAKRLLHNARCASATADEWVNTMHIERYRVARGENPQVRPHEIERFKHAFYVMWVVVVMASAPHLKERALAFLDECSHRELCRLQELSAWGRYYNKNEYGKLGLDLCSGFWTTAYDLIRTRWYALFCRGMVPAGPRRGDSPNCFWTFWDHTQHCFDYLLDE